MMSSRQPLRCFEVFRELTEGRISSPLSGVSWPHGYATYSGAYAIAVAVQARQAARQPSATLQIMKQASVSSQSETATSQITVQAHQQRYSDDSTETWQPVQQAGVPD